MEGNAGITVAGEPRSSNDFLEGTAALSGQRQETPAAEYRNVFNGRWREDKGGRYEIIYCHYFKYFMEENHRIPHLKVSGGEENGRREIGRSTGRVRYYCGCHTFICTKSAANNIVIHAKLRDMEIGALLLPIGGHRAIVGEVRRRTRHFFSRRFVPEIVPPLSEPFRNLCHFSKLLFHHCNL